jgi:hypothetical protein
MPYSFRLIKGNNIRIITKPTLAEALRSRHAYKKSPHFKKAFVGRVYSDIYQFKIPAISVEDIAEVYSNARKKRY